MSKILSILFSVFLFQSITAQKTAPFSVQKKKVAVKEIQFRNYQFIWDDSLKKDSIEFSWFTNTDKYKTLFPECELFNPGDNLSKGDFYIPSATRFNQHVIANFDFDSDSLLFRVTELDEKNLSKQFMPFYFKNVEVTNGEYKEFVRYVRDSIARKLLSQEFPYEYLKIPDGFKGDPLEVNLPLNWDKKFKYDDSKLMPILAQMYFPDHEKFYWGRIFDNNKLIYKYYVIEPYYYSDVSGHENNASNIIPHSIAIYPDSLCWVEDSQSGFGDPLMRNYFWHEAYDDYPVAGITWEQAQAFCIWKTEQLKKKMANKNLPFEFEVVLPKEYEWEYVLNKNMRSDRYIPAKKYHYLAAYAMNLDLDWKTNLIFCWGDKFDIYGKSYRDTVEIDNQFIYTDNELSGYYKIVNSASFTVKPEFLNYSVNYWSMSDNVSEWLDDDFYNYQFLWNFRAGALMSDTINLNFNTYKNEINNYSLNSSNIKISRDGKLVRGSNWFDKGSPEFQNFSMIKAQRKAFLNKDTQHATIGFRYVIRLKPKL